MLTQSIAAVSVQQKLAPDKSTLATTLVIVSADPIAIDAMEGKLMTVTPANAGAPELAKITRSLIQGAVTVEERHPSHVHQ